MCKHVNVQNVCSQCMLNRCIACSYCIGTQGTFKCSLDTSGKFLSVNFVPIPENLIQNCASFNFVYF